MSVILPVYNRESTITRAIKSVLNQSYDEIELIIVDDASDDNTVEMIRHSNDKRIVFIQSKSRGGAGKARNIGLKIAKGNYIAFQDSDDEWLPCKLEKQLSYMKKENYKISFTPYKLMEETKTLIIPYNYNQLDSYIISDILKKGNIIGTPTLVLEKEVIDNVGVFDESMPAWEDYELIIRIAKKYTIGCVKEILLHAYRQEQCISTNYGKVIYSAMYILRKHMDFVDDNAFFKSLDMYMNALISDYADITDFEDYLSDLTQSERVNLCKVFVQSVCKRYNVKSYCLETMCGAFESKLQNKEFYIYGAGIIARKTYERLKQKYISPQAFVVTVIGKEEKIDGIPIMELDNNFNVSMPILIAVSPKYHEEVAERLQKLGYFNYSFSIETINN